MGYWITVFNKKAIKRVSVQRLLDSITKSNIVSLCHQYGLSTALIQPALKHLEVVLPPDGLSPFFLLRYRPKKERQLVVYQWDLDEKAGQELLDDAIRRFPYPEFSGLLTQTQGILGIELDHPQLSDMGLLLAYEVARWAGVQSQGIVRDVEGKWYWLNRHEAFIPFTECFPGRLST